MTDKQTLLVEYQEGSKICMHYETLRRNALVFFVTVQGAIISVLFGLKGVTLIVAGCPSSPFFSLFGHISPFLEISLSSIAIFVGLLVLNNDIRTIDYYFGYIERLEEIEKELSMKLYSVQKKKILDTTRSVPNIIFFRGFPILTSCFWLIYIAASVFSHLSG